MTKDRTNLEVFARTSFYTALIVLFLFATYFIAYELDTPLDAMSPALSYTISGLSVCVAGGFLATVTMLVYLGVREGGSGLFDTPFYKPQLIKHIALFAVTGPAGLRGIDRILHHTKIDWSFLLDPEIAVLAIGWYIVVLVTSLYYNGAWVATSNPDVRLSGLRTALWLTIFECAIVLGLYVLYLVGP